MKENRPSEGDRPHRKVDWVRHSRTSGKGVGTESLKDYIPEKKGIRGA